VLNSFNFFWYRQVKRGAQSWGAVHPDLSAINVYYFFAGGQSNTGAGVFVATVEPLKNLGYPLKIVRFDPNAVVGNGELIGVIRVGSLEPRKSAHRSGAWLRIRE